MGSRNGESPSSLSALDQYNESNKIKAVEGVRKLVRTYRDDNTPTKIKEGLFLGSLAAAGNQKALKALNITHILTVARSLDPAHPYDFVYKIVPVVDKEDTDLERYFDECFEFIDEAKRQCGSVLVHCFVGKSRSVTIVVAYLMKKYNMSLNQALEVVKSKRPVANPNHGFIRQLQHFEKSMQGIMCA